MFAQMDFTEGKEDLLNERGDLIRTIYNQNSREVGTFSKMQ